MPTPNPGHDDWLASKGLIPKVSEAHGEKDAFDQKTVAQLHSPQQTDPSEWLALNSKSKSNGNSNGNNGSTLLTLPTEIRCMILANLLDVNQAHHVTVDWKPIPTNDADAATPVEKFPGDKYINDEYQYEPSPDEGEQGPAPSHHGSFTTRSWNWPYNITETHSDVPSTTRDRRLCLEVLRVCQQLHAEGSEILQKNKSKFIKVTTDWLISEWRAYRERLCLEFPVWRSKPAQVGDKGLLHIVCQDSTVEPSSGFTMLIAPVDLPRFMRCAHFNVVLLFDPEKSQGLGVTLPRTKGWGLNTARESFIRLLSESLGVYGAATKRDDTTVTRLDVLGGGEMSDLKGQLEQWISNGDWKAIDKVEEGRRWLVAGPVDSLWIPYAPHWSGATNITDLPTCIVRMLEDVEKMTGEETYTDTLAALYRLKLASYWAQKEVDSEAPVDPLDTRNDKLWAAYAWSCWRLCTLTDPRTEANETPVNRRDRLRWAHLHASQALALPTFMRTQREWEARLRLRRAELKLLLRAPDEVILNELFHVVGTAAPQDRCPPAMSRFEQRQWARAFVRGSAEEGWDAKVRRVRDLVNQTFGSKVQRTKDIVHPRNPARRYSRY